MPKNKLNLDLLLLIKDEIKNGVKTKDIAKSVGLSHNYITQLAQIKKRK